MRCISGVLVFWRHILGHLQIFFCLSKYEGGIMGCISGVLVFWRPVRGQLLVPRHLVRSS